MGELLYEALTHTIIGAYYEVYNRTSRTYPEYIYEKAMMEELRRREIRATRQDEYRILYKDKLVGIQRLDLFVVQEVVVENKVAPELTALHKAQAISYLKTVDKQVGLLFNFGREDGPELNRLYFHPANVAPVSPETVAQRSFETDSDWLYPDLAYQIIGGLYEVHAILGPGFIYRIYANACCHELELRGIGIERNKRMQVAYKGKVIGDIAFAHLLVEGNVMVFPVAVTSLQAIQLYNLKQWMQLCGVGLGILANFNAARLEVRVLRV